MAALGVLALAVALAATAYLLRREIGAELASQYLRSRGVESAVAIQQLGMTGFSGRLRLGPAGDPDITADRIDVNLTIAPPWSSAPFQIVARRIRLVRPRVKIVLKDGAISLGGLDRLIGPARPGVRAGPIPDLTIEDGIADITTPAGLLVVHGGGEVDGGRPTALNLRSEPATLRAGSWIGQMGAAALTVRTTGQIVTAELDAPVSRLETSGAAAGGGALRLRFSGDIVATGPLSVRGAFDAQAHVAIAKAADSEARSVAGAVNLPWFELASTPAGWRLAGGGAFAANAAALKGANGRFGQTSATVTATRFDAAFDHGRWSGAARLAGSAQTAGGQAAIAGEAMRITGAAAGWAGTITLPPTGLQANLTASLSAHGGLPASEADRLARSWLKAAGSPAYEVAVAAALSDVRLSAPKLVLTVAPGGVRLALGGPVTARSGSGAALSAMSIQGRAAVSSGAGQVTGAAVLSSSGGGLPTTEWRLDRYALSSGGLDADLTLGAALDVPVARHARLEAAGRVHAGPDSVTFDPTSCVLVSAERADLGGTIVDAPSGRLCGLGGGKLIALTPKVWRLHGRIDEGRAASALYQIRGDHITGALEANGGAGRAPAVSLHLSRAEIADTGTPTRFRPLLAAGAADLEGDVWRGRFTASMGRNQPIGAVEARHRMSTGEGQAILDAPAIRFVRGGLQPADLSPLAAAVRSAQGDVRFNGRLDWTRQGLSSSGRISTDGLDMASPAGAVTRVKADLRLTSLAPVTIAPGQVVTVEKIGAVVPLETIRIAFGLDAHQLSIASGHLSAAGGEISIEPVRFPLAGDGVARGVIVLSGIDLGKVVAASTLAEKVHLDAVVDGRLPFEFGPNGFKLLKGGVAAVRPGRLAIARDVFVGAVQPNAIQDFAYQALANLAFDSLSATIESRPGGRLGVIFHIKGRHDPAVGKEAYVGVRQLADGSAFQKPIPLPKGTPVDLTLDTSLNFDQLLGDYNHVLALQRGEAKPAAHSGAVHP